MNIKAEMFASTVYQALEAVLEARLKSGQPITRNYIKESVLIKLSRTNYAKDDRMAEYLTDSLAGSYIG